MSVLDHKMLWMDIAALEQRLRDRPGDLASWRTYADWLSEQGDARGALIRLEQRRERVAPSRRDALEREFAELVGAHQDGWDAALPEGATVLERRYGFATKVAVEWSDDAPVVIERALREPFVTALHVASPEKEYYWEGEDVVDADGEPLPDSGVDAGALATLNLGRLVELDLSYLRIGALGAKALAVSMFLRGDEASAEGIATLDLRYSGVGNSGLAALAASPSFGGVRRLHLQKNAITAQGMPALHRFAELTELDLRYNEIGAEGVRALLDAPFIGSLKRLLLYRADVGDDGAKMLAHAPQLPPALRSYWRSV
ncbi:TIGR02996 domain-containing protein [Spirillospora sp. NPDC048911]|uniref:TIGR02996 domain-containing protein n=1 Tax=Spirillospora sp. NPDC048911 TaxID=3364527 RepID=UPI00370F821D